MLAPQVTTSYYEYEELAVTLATDPEKLFQLRQKLEESRHTSALFDTTRWCAHVHASASPPAYTRAKGPEHGGRSADGVGAV
jgi:hypothetical protein